MHGMKDGHFPKPFKVGALTTRWRRGDCVEAMKKLAVKAHTEEVQTMNIRDIPVPPRMKRLERDRRGYPIPVIVLRDKTGVPHYTINDEHKRQAVIAHEQCSICGQVLNRARWFVGGPLSAFDPEGCYIDAPLHHECAQYALRVCPYLAAPNYNKRIDARTLKESSPDELKMVFVDGTMYPDRPDLFVAQMSIGQINIRKGTPFVVYVAPVRPCRRVEYWQGGEMLSQAQGEALTAEILKRPLPDRQAPRVWSAS